MFYAFFAFDPAAFLQEERYICVRSCKAVITINPTRHDESYVFLTCYPYYNL